jgi:nucleoside 2-deoxyribosyltransferase
VSDFFVAGSWRNSDAIEKVLVTLDEVKASAYCFVRVGYSAAAAALATPGGADEADPGSPAIRELFEQDIGALRAADRFLLVLPAGQAAHIEAGIAYGLGKPCYAVGPVERSETLYRIFDDMFTGTGELRSWLVQTQTAC